MANSRRLLLMRRQAISWMMFDADLKKKMLLKKKQEKIKQGETKVKKIQPWEYKKPLAIAG